MANLVQTLLVFLLPLISISSSLAQRPIFPNSIVLPITKDLSTHQYVTKIHMGAAPLGPTKLVLDLGGPFLWLDCADDASLSSSSSSSSSQHAIKCGSLQCSMAKSNGCTDLESKICTLEPENSVSGVVKSGNLAEDIVALKFRDGSHVGGLVNVHNFLFSCAPKELLEGLAGGVKGMLGLGNTRVALPSQLSTRFGFQRKFAMCLSSSNGALMAGDGAYVSSSGTDISKSLMYTPLVFNQGGASEEYYINVKSIKINGMKLSANASLLSLDENGNGGTKISTIAPYTTMESTLYEAFVKDFVDVASGMNMARVAPVAPFDVCFSSDGIKSTGVGPNVPIIDFVLQSEMVKWRVHGVNSMVQVSDEVMCLGFLNGGSNQKASIVIGGHQLEENLLEFNLGTSMLGFASLPMRQRSCSDFSLHPMSTD